MNVSLNWAQEVSNTDICSAGIDEVVKKIGAQLGAVEDVIDYGKRFKGVIVVKVRFCIKHPNADKLSVCMVEDSGVAKNVERDKDGLVQVVCGAPNIKAGQTVAWLPPGSTVPSTYNDKPFVLGARELRGVNSNGMIASVSELGIGEDHNGILVIEEEVKPGTSFVDLYQLNDYIIDCENKMFTHRPDCFGILGVARELAGIQGKQFNSPEWYTAEPKFVKTSDLTVEVDVKTDLVSRFSVIAMQNIKVGPSPTQMQADLSKVGIRPINNIVDITNWLMHLSSQPLHAYDYDKVVAKSKDKANLTARLSKKGNKVKLLNGKEIELKDDTTVLICANDKPIGIGGVMGGADTEVDYNTKNIIIECATFNMYNIRKTAMKYGLFTDAVTRFNKGQSPLQNAVVINKAMQMVQQHAGGMQASDFVDYRHKTVKPMPNVKTTTEFINVRLGSDFSADSIAKTLQLVEFEVTTNNDEITVKIPFWRRDIELPEDLVEEVGRLIGYDKLPVALPVRTASPVDKNELIDFKYSLRSLMAKVGANEVLTYSFVHGDLFIKTSQDESIAYKLSNALSPDLHYYRLSVLPSLLDKVHLNVKAGFNEFALFEIGKSHTKKLVEDSLPIEAHRLAFVVAADTKTAKNYQGAPYYGAKKNLDYLLKELGIKAEFVAFDKANAKLTNTDPAKPFYPNRSAVVQTLDGELLGVIGEFNSKVSKGFKLPEFSAGFELDIKQLYKATITAGKKYEQIPKYPKVTQDISLKVSTGTEYYDISKCVNDALRANQPAETLANIEPLDIYQKGNDKHFTFRLTIASYVKTLTAKEVNDLLNSIASAASKRLNAERL